MLSIRPVVSSTKLFAIAIILSTSAAARDSTAAALVLFSCICIALAFPSKAMQPLAPQAAVPAPLSLALPSLRLVLLACSPLPNVLMCGKRWCCCRCCHEAFATFLLRATSRRGMQRRRSHPFYPLIHSLIHSFSRLFRHSCNFHSYKQPSTQPWMHCQSRGRGQRQEAVWGVSGNMFVRMWKINEKIVNKSAKAEIKHGSLTHKHSDTHTDRHTHMQGHAFGCLHRQRQRQAQSRGGPDWGTFFPRRSTERIFLHNLCLLMKMREKRKAEREEERQREGKRRRAAKRKSK